MDQQFVHKVTEEMASVNLVERDSEEIQELEFREKLLVQNKQLEEAMQFLEHQIRQVKKKIKLEKKTAEGCERLEAEITERLTEVSRDNDIDTINHLRKELTTLQKKFDQDLRDMTDFFDEYYPAHAVDDEGPLGVECELKMIVEVSMV